MKQSLTVLAALTALVPATAAHARPATTKPQLQLSIHVALTDTRIVLDPHHAPRGVEARFVIENTGTKAHNITLEAPKAGRQKGFTRTVPPHRRTVVRVFLDVRAKLPYRDALPADRGKPAMRGVFVIN